MSSLDPKDIIPHRPPFLFLDYVYDIVPGKSAKGIWNLTGEEDFFKGHFPNRPTLPGVLMVEAMAQLGAVALLSEEQFKGKLVLFGGVDKARFRRQVVPGDVLELEVELGSMSKRAGKGTGRGILNNQVACEAGMLFIISDFS